MIERNRSKAQSRMSKVAQHYKGDEQSKAVISVKVFPRSSRNEIIGKEAGIFKVRVTAPPVEGMANKALKHLFAKRLGVPKRNIEIISGEQSRLKMVQIQGLSLEDVSRLLGRDI